MELYIEPLRPLKRKTRFYKGDIPWNKGRKGWSTNNEKKKKIILANLAAACAKIKSHHGGSVNLTITGARIFGTLNSYCDYEKGIINL